MIAPTDVRRASSARLLSATPGAALVVLAALALTACGGSGGSGTRPTVTTTVTTSKAPSASGSATPSATASVAVSQVKGRTYDVGAVVGFKHAGGLAVLVLDRWTVRGISDAKLAANGIQVQPHQDSRFVNENSSRTYTVPVNPSATIVKNTCVDKGHGAPTMTSTPLSLHDFLVGPHRSTTIVLLTYDDSGRLARLDTDPAC